MQPLDSRIMGLLERTLDTTLQRQNVLSGNVANLDTPGFTPQDVDFEAALREVMNAEGVRMETTHNAHLSTQYEGTQDLNSELAPVFERPDREAGLDGNAVDLDRQMARLAQNSILYASATRATNKKLALMRYAVSDGGM